MTKLLHGLFTTHLVTKVVSLLLASVLFVFTQQSISDEQTIDELTIRFELAPDLAKAWVLNKPTVVLKQMKVSGLRRDLAVQTGALRRADFIITKVITQQFLRDYYDDKGGPILIDADLLRAEELPWDWGDEFQLKLTRPEQLDLERLREVTFRPVLTDAMRQRLTLPESSPFRAADGGLVVVPEWVQPNGADIGAISISGPDSKLPVIPAAASEAPLYIVVPDLAAFLRNRTTLADAREPIPIDAIDWMKSGVRDIKRLYVRAPLSESLESLEKQTLHFRCDLKLTPTHIQVTLPFAFSTPAQGELTLASVAKEYRYFGRNERSPFDFQPTGAMTEWIRVVNLDLEVTEAWKGREAELAELFFLEIDIANATKPTEIRLEMPIRLKPRTTQAERILADGEVHLPDPVVIFQSRPQ